MPRLKWESEGRWIQQQWVARVKVSTDLRELGSRTVSLEHTTGDGTQNHLPEAIFPK